MTAPLLHVHGLHDYPAILDILPEVKHRQTNVQEGPRLVIGMGGDAAGDGKALAAFMVEWVPRATLIEMLRELNGVFDNQ